MTKTLDALQAMLCAHPEPTAPSLYKAFTPTVVCADGTTLSVQASRAHYSSPREDTGPYTAVEVGFPSSVMPKLLRYAEDPEQDPTRTVYPFVPLVVVAAAIDRRGGLKEHNPNPSEEDRLRAAHDVARGQWRVALQRLNVAHKAFQDANEAETLARRAVHASLTALCEQLRRPDAPTPTPTSEKV
jgi:hypothetical protein